MKKRIKTVAITGNYARWVYQFRLGLMRKLQELGLKVVVVAAADRFEKKFLRDGFDFEPIKINFYGNNPFDDLITLWQLFLLYRRRRIDLAIHFTIKPNIFGGIAAKLLGIPSYAVVTGLGHIVNEKNGLISSIGILLYRFTLRLHKKVLVLNARDAKELVERKIVATKKIHLLPGEGVDTNFFRPLSDKKMREYPSFLFSGRLMEDKGIYEFVEAARIIQQKYPYVKFKILGMLDTKGINSVSVSTIKQWVNEGVIEYLGETLDVRPFLAKADCVVLPSYYREGLSRILMEAASMETPIITTDQPGCKEVVEDERTGFLCKLKDVDDLVRTMEQFVKMDKIDRLIMGKNARLKMEREFDEQIIIDQYLALLDENYELAPTTKKEKVLAYKVASVQHYSA